MTAKQQAQKKGHDSDRPRVGAGMEQTRSEPGALAARPYHVGLPVDLPNHSTAKGLRQAQVLQMQRLVGNACTQRMLARELSAKRRPGRKDTLRQHTVYSSRAVGLDETIQRDIEREERYVPYTIEPPERRETHETYNRLDIDERRRPVPPAVLSRRIREAEARGHDIIRQRRRSTGGVLETRVYERIPHYEPVSEETELTVNGVAIPIRNATRDELSSLRGTLELVPGPHLTELVNRRNRIVIVDWTGAPHPSVRQLGGGANIRATRTRRGITESGPRIEITHTAMAQDGGRLTLLHEMGHVVYEAGLIPRQVSRRYGGSVHTGQSEQPSYAYMYYLMNPARLSPRDRGNFDAEFRRQGLQPRGQPPAEEGQP